MEPSERGQLVVRAEGDGASLRPAGASAHWRGWPFGGRRRRAKMASEGSSSGSPLDKAGGHQEQAERQRRECSRRGDNNHETPPVQKAQISIGQRLRFSLSSRAGSEQEQHLVSWRDKLAAGGQPTSSSGHAKQPAERRAIVRVGDRGGAEQAHNNGGASQPAPAGNHDAAGPEWEDDSRPDSKILLRQYLPNRSFNLNADHTPSESNNKFAASPSQTEASGGGGGAGGGARQAESVDPKRRAVRGGQGGASERPEGAQEEAAAQVDDERINFARTKERQKVRRRRQRQQPPCQATDNSGNNELQASLPRVDERRAGPDFASELSGRARKRADPVEPASSSLAKSIASAWSRLKISPSGGRRNNQRSPARSSSSPVSACKSALLLNNHEREEYEECEPQVKTGARQRRRCKQSVLETRRGELELLKVRQQVEQSRAAIAEAPLTGDGLLHSKEWLTLLTAGRPTDGPRIPANRITNSNNSSNNSNNNNNQTNNKPVRPKLAIDLNNNLSSATSFASNLNQRLSNYAQQLGRRGTRESDCLLEEEEEEEEEEEAGAAAAAAAAAEEEEKCCEEELEVEDLEEPKMSPLMSGKQEERRRASERLARSKFALARRRTEAKGSQGGGKSLLVAASSAIWLLLVLAGAQMVLGQQAPPFARSQRPQTAPVGAGPPPLPMSNQANLAAPSARGERPLMAPTIGSLVANISCNKIRGHVTLTPNLEGGATVTTQITAGPPGEVYQWSIHQFPVKPGAAMCSCSSLILGSKLVDLSEMHGNLPSEQEFSVQSSLQLFDFDSPVGHSLLLRGLKTGMVACGTFLPTNRKSNYRAKFHTPLSGSVTIFQTSFGTSFLSHLMYSNGTRRHSTHRFDLVRSHDEPLTSSLLTGAGGLAPAARSNIEQLEQREHENELQACKRFSTGEPLFKNLTYQLSVSTENFGMRGRTALVLPQIPFESFSSVYVVVYSEHDASEPMACAPLRFVKPKTAAAKFQTNSVQGSIVFSQDSPYDVTVARVHLNFPNSDGHSYGIDELPMIIRRKSDTRVCPNVREIIYNPHHVEPSSVPAEGEATSDQYAVGDLSGKYGSLTGKATERITAADHNLPLFGPVSIVGRALTIYSADGVAMACSNVELTTPMTTAFATFDYGIQGQFIFRQPMNDCNGDTYVYIEVSKPSAPAAGPQDRQQQQALAAAHDHSGHSQTRSLDHNWHIHVNPVDSGLEHLSTTECSPAGPHYNPYNTSTATIYSRDCTPFNVLRCELGDLSSKMFTIEIPPYKVKSGGQEPDIGKFFGTDIELPLCGPTSIVNRSVVVHVADFGSQRLACSTVIEFKPRT